MTGGDHPRRLGVRHCVLPIVLAVSVIAGPVLAASKLAKPTGRVILTVTGAIEYTNRDGRAVFDRAMLKQFKTVKLRTSTSWTKGRPVFEGVLVRDVLRSVNATGEKVVATALNDYSITIPVSDFDDYDVVLALEMNGKKLTARDKGPIWIVYPRDSHSELQNQKADAKWIWQLTRLKVE